MIWLDKLERRFGFLAIPGLIRIVIAFTALVWALMWLNPNFRFALDLDPARIRHGEVWRLVTYIFVPQTLSFWIVLALWFLWFIGEGLERAWGPFRLTLYFFVGMIGTTVAAFFFGSNFSNGMLIASLLHPFYSAGKNQMARLGFRRVLAARICVEFEFLSRRAHSSVRELSHIFRSRNCSSGHASP